MEACVELSEKQLAFLSECEEKFKDRFTMEDRDYKKEYEEDSTNTPPVCSDWVRRPPRRNWDGFRDNRPRRRSPSRSPLNNRTRDYEDRRRDGGYGRGYGDRRNYGGRDERRYDGRNRNYDERDRRNNYRRDYRDHDQGGSWQDGRNRYDENR